MAFVKCQAYRTDFGFFETPPRRVRNVTGTSITRAC